MATENRSPSDGNASFQGNQSFDDSRQANFGQVTGDVTVNLPVPEKPIAITSLITEPPAIAHWQGRVAEVKQIEIWFEAKKNIAGIQGIGGVGKSAIAAYVFVEKAGGFAEKLWLEVTGQPSFDLVLDTGLARLGKFTTERLEKLDSNQKLSEFVRILTDRRCLLVLDNLESVLDEERQLGSGYADFLQLWSDRGRTSTILLTTRDVPKILETLPSWLPPLQGLRDRDGAALLEAEGIIAEESDRLAWSRRLFGHPLTLRLMAGFLRIYGNSHLDRAASLGLENFQNLTTEMKGAHRGQQDVQLQWILQQHFDRLSEEMRSFLVRLSVFRIPISQDLAGVLLNESVPLKIAQSLQDLAARSLLVRTEDGDRVQPLVAAFAGEISDLETWQDAHIRAIDYFSDRRLPFVQWRLVSDLSAYFELFHHFCELKMYGLALNTLETQNDEAERYSSCRMYVYFRGGLELSLLPLYQRLEREWKPNNSEKGEYANTLKAIGDVLQFLDRRTEALERYEAALAFYREIGARLGEANVLQEFAKLQTDPRQGIEALQTAQEIYEQIGDQYSQSRNLFFISERQIKCGEIEAAILSLRQAEAIAIEIDYEPFINRASQQIAQLTGGFMGGLMDFIRFAQRGWLQFILCFLLGAIAFPFLLIAAAILILWRLIKEKVKR